MIFLKLILSLWIFIPFEETVKTAENSDEIIEKIDIGGISLIRAAAKNLTMYLLSGRDQYPEICFPC